MAIEKITKFSDAIQPADIINEVVDVVNNADLEEFVGASESQAGKKGIVPAPEAGSEDRYLNADGTWKEVKQNLTVYTSLEQIGITPGEETFESIYNALPINSELIYYITPNNYNNSIYPITSYGILDCFKTTDQTSINFIFYYQNSNKVDIYTRYYNNTYPNDERVWSLLATNLDLNNYLPLSGGTITGNLTVNGTITGTTVIGAVYNDYAEFFPRGEETETGDIIMLDPNSDEEKYIKASTSIITEYPLVVGIHSEEYSHLIGGELPKNGEDFYDYNIDKYIPVGLAGRCKVKIKGKAIKGAPVTFSDIPGVGICSNNITNNSIVGYLVESDNIEDENTIRLLKVKLK